MAERTAKTLSVHVELPADGLPEGGAEPAEVAKQLELLWVLEQVRHHRISAGRGAELAGLRRYDFMLLMSQHGIPVIDLSPEELDAELAALEGLTGSR